MSNASDTHRGRGAMLSLLAMESGTGNRRRCGTYWRLAILAAAVSLLAVLAFGQTNARVASVDPITGKVNDSIALVGENLGKGSVVAVFLSDDKLDYKASFVNQAAEKITVKIPQVKPGSYNISIQVGNSILIQPVMFTVGQ